MSKKTIFATSEKRESGIELLKLVAVFDPCVFPAEPLSINGTINLE